MANEFKIKKGLIVTGASGGTVVDIQGSQGQLFSVTDDLSGSIFAVSDISGVPIFDVNSSGQSTFVGDVTAPTFLGDLNGTINTATTGVTQTAGNNSTLIATTAYADAAAAAIPIGNYLPLAGGTMTGDLLMDGKAGVGNVIGLATGINSNAMSLKLYTYNNIDPGGGLGTSTGNMIQADLGSNLVLRQTASDGDITFQSDDGAGGIATYLTLDGSSTDAYFSNPGNVGIGVTSPSEKLHVSGSAIVTSNLYSSREISGTIVSNDYYRIIELNGGSGRGKCSFTLQSNGGSGVPFLLKGTVNAVWGNSESSVTVDFNSRYSAVEEIRVVRNTSANKTFVDVKMSTEDNVEVFVLPFSNANAIAVGFTNVTTLPSGDTVETVLDVHDKAFALRSITGTAEVDQFNITNDIKIGVGTPSPIEKIHLKNNGDVGIALENIADTSGDYWKLWQDNWNGSSNFTFNVNYGGADHLTVRTDGNVGIGTTSPNEKLHAAGNIHAYDASGIDAGLFASTAAGSTTIAIRSLGITHFNGGNVGIGTTSPSYKFELQVSQPDENPVVYSQFGGNNGVTGNSFLQIGGARGSAADERYSYLQTLDGAGGFRILSLNPSGGNVGIGVTGPTDKLTVNGNLSIFGNKIYNGSASNSAGVSFPSSTTRIDGYNGITFHSSLTTVGSQTERMRITSSGNVGIGTTSPLTKLEVYDGDIKLNDSTRNLLIGEEGSSSYQIKSSGYLIIDATSGIQINKTTSGNVTIGSGNVGIGTTSPNNFGFLEKVLNISAGSSSSTTLQQAGIVISGSSDADDADDFGYLSFTNYQSAITNDRVAEIRALKNGTNVDTGEFAFYTSSGSGPAERMRIDSSGNVGIGTSSPAVQLELGDNTADEKLRLTGAASGKPLMTFYNTTTKIGQIASSSVGVTVTSLGSGNMSFENGGNTRLVIDNSGNVGIGTTIPSYKLDVDGEGRFGDNGGILLTDDSGTSYVRALNNHLNLRTTRDADDIYFSTGTTTTTKMFIEGNTGSVGIGTTGPSEKLHVYNGTTYVTPIAYAANQSAYALKIGAYNSTSFDMGLQAKSTSGGSPYMSFITTSVDDALTIWGGSVGVGGIGIPSYTLDVNGVIRGEQYLRLADTGGTNRFSIRAESTYGTIDNGSNTLNYNANNHLFLVGLSEKMRINSSGNVGIGTTNPTSQLGSTKVLDISSTGNGEIILDHTDAGVSSDIGLYSWNRNNDHLAHIKATCDGATDSAFISFHAQPTGGSFSNAASNEKMRIKSNGDVGIGTTSPLSKLHVNGGDIEVQDSSNGLILRSPNGTRYRITVDNSGNLTTTAI